MKAEFHGLLDEHAEGLRKPLYLQGRSELAVNLDGRALRATRSRVVESRLNSWSVSHHRKPTQACKEVTRCTKPWGRYGRSPSTIGESAVRLEG